MKSLRPLLLALLLAAVPSAAAAQADTPEAAAAAYGRAMASGDLAATAELMHPDALEEFKTFVVEFVGFAAESGEPEAKRELTRLFGFADAEAARAAPAEEVYRRFFGGPVGQGLAEVVGSVRVVPIGHVPEGGDAHVVARMEMEMEGVRLTRMNVISLRPDGDRWKVLLTADIRQFVESLRRQLPEGR